MMKKLILILFVYMILISTSFVLAQNIQNNQVGRVNEVIQGYVRNNSGQTESNETGTGRGIGNILNEQIRERIREFKEGNYTGPMGQNIQVRQIVAGLLEMRANNFSVRTAFNITIEENETSNQTMLKVKLSNGKNAEIKIMPDSASERAIERLRLKVCSSENNCTIELKEVGANNQTRAAYDIQAEKESKMFGMFKKKMQVQAQVDAETGEIIESKKPWWAFLASE